VPHLLQAFSKGLGEPPPASRIERSSHHPFPGK